MHNDAQIGGSPQMVTDGQIGPPTSREPPPGPSFALRALWGRVRAFGGLGRVGGGARAGADRRFWGFSREGGFSAFMASVMSMMSGPSPNPKTEQKPNAWHPNALVCLMPTTEAEWGYALLLKPPRL